MSWLDLHLHSAVSSDGEISPRGLAELCRQERIELAALTDHNSVAGVNEFMWRCAQLGVRAIAGVELDCMLDGLHLHILGYGIDIASPAFAEIEASVLQMMQQVSQRQMDAVARLGICFDRDAVTAKAHNGVVTPESIAESVFANQENQAHPLVRPLLDGELSKRPLVNFYWALCAPGKPAHVPVEYIPAAQAVMTIHAANGLAVLAHPGANIGMDENLAEKVLSLPLDGIEAFSSYHDKKTTAFYKALAEKHGLLLTGGSDFHGKTKPDIRLGSVHYDGDGSEPEIRDALLAALVQAKNTQ